MIVFDMPDNELIEMLNRGKQLNARMLMAVVHGMMRVRKTKQPLQPGQTGRTHKRKPRGTRKRKNMSVRQLMNHFQRKDLWR